ncbi:hypothetical protein PR002_g32843, partial [Phytophthora rubi]
MGKGKSVVLATDSAFELQSTADKCCFRMPDAHEDGNDSGAAAGSPTEESCHRPNPRFILSKRSKR